MPTGGYYFYTLLINDCEMRRANENVEVDRADRPAASFFFSLDDAVVSPVVSFLLFSFFVVVVLYDTILGPRFTSRPALGFIDLCFYYRHASINHL